MQSSRYPVPLPSWPLETVRRLAGSSPIWLAGGPVRDLLMARRPKDWDFVVLEGAIPLARSCADALDGAFYALDVGRGTGRAIVQPPIPKGHKPSGGSVFLDFAELRGATLLEDLRLRDFTINAMAMTLEGELIDPMGGMDDLAARQIRLTYPGSLRADPVRLLRAVRFVVELGFVLHKETHRHIAQQAGALREAAAERIRDEMLKILALPGSAQGYRLLRELSLLDYALPGELTQIATTDGPDSRDSNDARQASTVRVLQMLEAVVMSTRGAPEISSRIHHEPAMLDAVSAVSAVTEAFKADLVAYLDQDLSAIATRRRLLPWCVLFSELIDNATAKDERAGLEHTPLPRQTEGDAAAAVADQAMTSLRFSAKAREFVATVLRESRQFATLRDSKRDRRACHRYFRDTGDAGVAIALLALAQQYAYASTAQEPPVEYGSLETARCVFKSYFRLYDQVVAPPLLLTGHDLVEMGLSQGPVVGRVLMRLREAQAAGEITTEAQARDWAQQMVREATRMPHA